jgi:sugar phosphate isomerase/epimerase
MQVRGDLRDYARLGAVHHMMYPGCVMDPDYHVRTLEALLGREDIETLDFCVPYGAERRQRLVEACRSSGKGDVAYALYFFPATKLWFSTPLPHEQAQIRLILRDTIQQAVALGAKYLVFAAGGPPYNAARHEDFDRFARFCRWLSGELKPHGIVALMEPSDWEIDKGFLYGPTEACVRLIESLRPEVDNLALNVDLAHAPLMGEALTDAIRDSVPYLQRVHVGNCIMTDPEHELYGDMHPPIGMPGGEVDTAGVAEIFRCLLEVGYLSRESRGCVLLEARPWPDMTPEDSFLEQMARLQEAWELA